MQGSILESSAGARIKARVARRNSSYENLEMAEYLLPTCELDNKEKQKLFEIRNDMTNIPSNYGKQNECLFGELENMIHISHCA